MYPAHRELVQAFFKSPRRHSCGGDIGGCRLLRVKSSYEGGEIGGFGAMLAGWSVDVVHTYGDRVV